MSMPAFRHAAREAERSRSTVRHDVAHPVGSAAHADWAQAQTLHLAVAYSNPLRFRSRRELFEEFRRHAAGLPNVVLHVAELAYGDLPYEVTSADCPTDHQFRTREVLWHKENLLNLTVWNFPDDWEYGGWVDGDVAFARRDVALEAIHRLQAYDFVQLFSHVTDLGPDREPLNTRPGFAFAQANGLDVVGKPMTEYGWPGSPGFGWAFRREAYQACGGLLDTCILGSADHHMAVGLAGLKRPHYDTTQCGRAYARSITVWQKRAYAAVRGNVGHVPGVITHGFHGPRGQRGYEWRWQILRDHGYNPYVDLFRDDEGLYQLTRGKPKLRDAIRAYMSSRDEDSREV